MDYQTLITESTNWFVSDVTNCVYVLAAIATLGVLNAFRLSLNHCKGRTGRIL